MEHGNAALQQGATIHLFNEESCWTKDEQYRTYRIPVAFTLQSIGRRLGKPVRLEFTGDYGLYYHGDEDELVRQLALLEPSVDWNSMVFHRQHDKSRVSVICPDTDREVAAITTRRYIGKPVQAEAADAGYHGANVISFSGIRGRLDILAVRAIEREREKAARWARLREQGVLGS